jgi:hypothetical protein
MITGEPGIVPREPWETNMMMLFNQVGNNASMTPIGRENHKRLLHLMFLRILRACLVCLVAAGVVAAAHASFIETYDDGTDVGLWVAAFSVPRIIEPNGGNPGAYLQQGDFSTHTPTWTSASPRYQPGINDDFKVDSVYTGDWAGIGVISLSVDLNIIQAAAWGTDRAVTMQLLQMDETGFNVNYEATYTLPDLPDVPPVGWQTYSFPVDANSSTIPPGWVFTRGDGTPASDAEWSVLMSRIDLTSVGYYKPGFAYPGFGTWILGIDNVNIQTVQEPRSTPTPRPRPSPPPRPTSPR